MEVSLVATEVCAWPVLGRLRPDALGLVHFNRPSHGLEEGDLAALISRDEGRTWQPAGVPAPHDPGANRMHLAAGIDTAGRWIVLSTGFRVAAGEFVGFEPLWCSTLSAAGGAWEIRRELALAEPIRGSIPHGRIVSTGDGRLAAAFYRSEGRGCPSRAWIAFSADDGASWPVAHEIDPGDANEVCLLRREAGRWLAAARTQADHHLALHASDDAGQSWLRRGDLTLPMQHPGDLVELGAARLLLTFGLRNRGLMGIGARLSRDGGGTWGAPAVLHQFGDEATDCGYPSTVACSDGSLLTACYSDLSSLYRGYHLLALRWRLEEFFEPRSLRSISDGRPLEL